MIAAGLSVTKVAKKLSVAKDTVKAAITSPSRSVALEALESRQISLTEAAVLTEFEQDGAEAVDRLVAAGTPQFDHVVSQLRSSAPAPRPAPKPSPHYTERGFTMIDDDDRWGWKPGPGAAAPPAARRRRR